MVSGVLKQAERLDTRALQGLRGLASIQIMIYHYYGKMDILGPVVIPLFYLLSGFCLALKYGRTQWTGMLLWGNFPLHIFYWNRIVRILPLFYIVNMYNFIIAWPLFSKAIVYKTLLTLTLTNTWFLVPSLDISAFFPFSETSWTISTLTAFYLLFPILLQLLQRIQSQKLGLLLIVLFHLQCWPILLTRLNDNYYYWFSTSHPISRLPVFTIGIIGGILRVRKDQEITTIVSKSLSSLPLNFLNDIMPWRLWRTSLSPICPDPLVWQEQDKLWAWRVDLISLFACAVTYGWLMQPQPRCPRFLMEGCPPVFSLNPLMSLLRGLEQCFGHLNQAGQMLMVHLDMILILGLTTDGERSITGKILRTQPLQMVGRISMALYLVHWPVWEGIDALQDLHGMTDMNQTIPIVINLVVSLILATGGTLFSEWIAKLLIPRTQTLINS